MARQPLDKMKVIPGGGFKDPIYTKQWGFTHLAADYFAEYVPVYAHLEGDIIGKQWGNEGGWWLLFRGIDKYIIRAAHHKNINNLGHYSEGAIIATTGNTGTHRDGTPNSPHWHCEVINPLGIHVDPNWYFNQLKNINMTNYQNSIVRNRDTGGFFFFKGTKDFEMARQPLSPNTIGYAQVTLMQVWGDKHHEHVYEMTDEEMKAYALVWEHFPCEDQSFIDSQNEANKN